MGLLSGIGNTTRKLCIACFFLLLSSSSYALPTLGLGPFGPGVQDGSAPFDTDGNCATATAIAGAGDDCGESNNQVRTQDTVIFNWSVTANNYTAGQTNPKNVLFEQILRNSTNAVVTFERIPARCTVAGGGGSNPASSIGTEANGDIKLTCNMGEFAEGAQLSFSTVAKVSGESWNGETFTSNQRVYSNADDGTANAVTATTAEIGPIAISARPMMDLRAGGFQGYYLYGSKDMGTGLGPESGYWTWVNMRVASERKTGTEAIKQPFTYTLDLSATKQAVNGTDYTNSGFEYLIHDCFYNRYSWHGGVYGSEVHGASNLTTYPLNRKVIDSGTCSFSRDDPADKSSPYKMSITDADLSGSRFPTQTIAGADLSAGPYYFVDMVTRFFIPMRVIDNEDGVIDGVGSIYIKNILKEFDPVGVSGVLNFNGLKEPGYNGNPMPDGTISNNITPAYNYYLTTRGTWADYAFKTNKDTGTGYSFFIPSSSHSGQGLLAPTQAYPHTLHFGNNGSTDLRHPRACIAFDNSTQKLTDRSKTGGTAGTYAYVGTYNAGDFDSTNYTVEYGHVDYTGDDPLKNGYNNQTGRYEGDWTAQGNVRCDDAVTTWTTDPTQVGIGIDDVNIVRVRLKDSVKDSVALTSAQYIRFVTPLEARETFYKGSHDGTMIPVGTVLAGFGSVRSDEYASAWTPAANTRPYQPAPESGHTDGDRVTLARTTSFLDSESLLPVAAPGASTSTLAGKQIVWKVTASIQSLLNDAPEEANVQIIDELPAEVSYNQNCTASYVDGSGTVIGTPADLVQYNTDRDGNAKQGYTRLVWNLGTVKANDIIAPRVICTDSDPLAPNGTAVINYAEIRGDSLISALTQRSDTHTISLEQIGSIQVSKEVDTTLDDVNDTQIYTLSWANFAPSFAIDAPTIIDVFPFNGDGSGSSARLPSSNFTGALELIAPPSTTWLDGATDGAPLGTWFYTTDDPATINHDPDNNSSNWVLEAALGGDFSQVTAIKFVSAYPLEKDGDPHQGMKATLTLQAGDSTNPTSNKINKPGEIYGNLFTLDTSSLPANQFLKSNTVAVQIASYSVGDLIFADVDGDLKYTNGTDIPAPDGIVVELYKASDNSLIGSTTTGIKGRGRYLFIDIGSGNYYVTIPANQFANNAVLAGWDSLVTVAGVDDDKNDDANQDGYTTGNVNANGVRTHVFTLSAIPPLPGEVPKGNEPLSDNLGGIQDTIGDDFSNYTLDIGLKPALDYGDAPTSYGNAGHGIPTTPTVYLGTITPDTESQLQNTANGGQDGSGDDKTGKNDEDSIQLLPTLKPTDTRFQVNIATHNTSTQDAVLIGWVDFNNDGVFSTDEAASVTISPNAGGSKELVWSNIAANTIQTGTLWMRLRLSTDSYLTSQNPSGAVFDGEVEDYALTVTDTVRVSGHVFNDANVSAGIKEANEQGINKVTLVLHNTANNQCISTKTDSNGFYQFSEVSAGQYTLYEAANEVMITPNSCPPAGKDPNSYRSTTANTRSITVTNSNISQQDFGDVALPTFMPNHTGTVLADNVVFYTHQFMPKSTGSVTFSSNNSGNITAGWSSILYEDTNCNGTLEGAEANTPILAALITSADTKLCIINKAYAPANVVAGESYTNVITANFDFNGNALAGTTTLTVTDLSKAEVQQVTGNSRLKLIKKVENISQGTPITTTQNQAKSGDTLKYYIHYKNTGTGPITDLKINDTVPEFTTLNGLPSCQLPLPASLTSCTANVNGDDIEWIFGINDVLKGGSEGVVDYQVTID
jgi:uncharacterized repeat protein (TIGR01451 family)